jgi:hypothetical protein
VSNRLSSISISVSDSGGEGFDLFEEAVETTVALVDNAEVFPALFPVETALLHLRKMHVEVVSVERWRAQLDLVVDKVVGHSGIDDLDRDVGVLDELPIVRIDRCAAGVVGVLPNTGDQVTGAWRK